MCFGFGLDSGNETKEFLCSVVSGHFHKFWFFICVLFKLRQSVQKCDQTEKDIKVHKFCYSTYLKTLPIPRCVFLNYIPFKKDRVLYLGCRCVISTLISGQSHSANQKSIMWSMSLMFDLWLALKMEQRWSEAVQQAANLWICNKKSNNVQLLFCKEEIYYFVRKSFRELQLLSSIEARTFRLDCHPS